jgi:hypothetical protein
MKKDLSDEKLNDVKYCSLIHLDRQGLNDEDVQTMYLKKGDHTSILILGIFLKNQEWNRITAKGLSTFHRANWAYLKELNLSRFLY